jgi:hypothetical protein
MNTPRTPILPKAAAPAAQFDKPDAVNPAMTLWLTIEDQRRRVTDLERWATRTV